jgi:hypothetical protein
MAYLRFEMRRTGEGLFHLLDRLRYQNEHRVLRHHRAEVDDLRVWLFTQTWAPPGEVYRARGHPSRPRTWWLTTATEHTTRAWRVCHLLNVSGIPLRPLRADACPGIELFRDECQAVVAADPAWIRRALKTRKHARRRGPGWSGDRSTIRCWDWTDPPGRLPAYPVYTR